MAHDLNSYILFSARVSNMRLVLSFMILLSTLVSTNANAWFFFFLPGSVTGKIADSVTGAEGEHCVAQNAKIGDVIKLPNGGTATIKSLSGTTSRCTQPELPIRALLDFSTSSSFTSKAGINLPAFWEPKSLTEQQKLAGAILMAKNVTLSSDTGLLIHTMKREIVPDMMAGVVRLRSQQASRLDEPQESEIEQISINGVRAWRFEVAGKTKGTFGNKFTYLTTVLEGDKEVVVANAWTPTILFEKQKEALKQLAKNITGIDAPASPVVAAPSTEPVDATPNAEPVVATPSSNSLPTQSESAANKLRDLNALYKEGVINKKDYETKKQEILKAM